MQILLTLLVWCPLVAARGCYVHPRGCDDCTTLKKCCAGTDELPGAWSGSCSACEDDSMDAADAGCYIHSRGGWLPAMTKTACSAANGGRWMASGCDECNTTDTAVCVPSPPSPPSAPSIPPSVCQPIKGESLAKTTAATPEAVNEPCYSHSTCNLYGHPGYPGYVCCVTKGTCDDRVSNTQKYYEGGCRGVNYARNSSNIVAAAVGQENPATDEGCVKQGECSIPYAEQIMTWTATGSAMSHATPSDATMGRLLAGATEAHTNACREIYPLTDVVPAVAQVSMTAALQGTVADFTTAKVDAMKATIAAKLGVPKANVAVTVAAGSVVLTIVVYYPTLAAAAAAQVTIATAMSSNAAAGAFLSSPSHGTVVVTEISAAPVAALSVEDKLSTGAIAGIAVGASVAVLLVALIAFASRKKKPSGKGGAN